MEEITLWAPEDEQSLSGPDITDRPRASPREEPELQHQLRQIHGDGLKTRDRLAFTPQGRRRRQQGYEATMKRLAKRR